MEIEEVKKALDENQELRQGVLSHVNKSEWGQEFVENTGKSYFEKNRETLVSPIVKEIHSRYDEDYEETFGEKRPDGVKTYDAWKQKVKQIKDGDGSKAEVEKWKKQATELQEKMEQDGGVQHWKELYNTTKDNSNQQIEELKGQLSEYQTEIKTTKVKNQLNSALTGLKLNQNINENLRNDTINRIFSTLASSSEQVDDTLIFKDSDGKTITNDMNAPITAKELVERELKRYDLLEQERNQKGGGSDGSRGGLGTNDKGEKVLTLDMSKVETKADLTKSIEKTLVSKGIPLSSDEGRKLSDEAYKRYGEGLPLH